MVNYVSKEELKEYLFGLPPNYITFGYPYDKDFGKIIVEANKTFREVVWELILSDHKLSLCSFSEVDGLKLKLHKRIRKIKDDKLFISFIFETLNNFYFEYHAPIYKYTVIKKMQELSSLYDELEIIENGLSKTSAYKTSKKKRNILREDARQNIRKVFKTRIENVIKEATSPGFDKIIWNQKRKRNEKIIIISLYHCFKFATESISQQDIFCCIAKVTLLFGTYLRSQAVINDEPITSKMMLDESKRVEQIYRRFKPTISSS